MWTKIIQFLFKRYCKKIAKNLNKYVKKKFNEYPTHHVRRNNNIEIKKIDSYICYEISPKKNKSNKVIMYIHGGAFISPITWIHYWYISKLIKNTKATVYVPIYPLAKPNHSTHDECLKFLFKLYKEIIKITKPNNITIMGESAGGNLTLVLGLLISKYHFPNPKNLIALSPCVDATYNKEQIIKMCKTEPVLPTEYIIFGSKCWINKDNNPKNWDISPIYGNNKNTGKITLVTGKNECFYNQILDFHNKLTLENIKHNFFEVKNGFHAFPLFPIKEAKNINHEIYKLL